MVKWILLALFEVFVVWVCIFIAKKMVANRTGLTKFMVIGKDDEETIKEMENIVRRIILTGKFEMSAEYEGYEVMLKAKEGCVGEVSIESSMTKISWHFIDGWKTKELAFTEKSAVSEIAFLSWCITFVIQFIIAYITYFNWLIP